MKIFTQVVWDEDGQTMERVYQYSVEEPGLWTAEKQWRPMEKVMKQKGIGSYYTYNQYVLLLDTSLLKRLLMGHGL